MDKTKPLYRAFRLSTAMDAWLANRKNAPKGASAFIREAVEEKIREVDPSYDKV